MQELDKKDFPAIYQLMEKSFPPDEYRPYAESRALLEHPAYAVSVSYEDRLSRTPGLDREQTGCPRPLIAGFIASWSLPVFSFIEHFAVDPAMRNNGFGSRLLQTWSAACEAGICLEVEPPETEKAKRRIAFYERNGFHLNLYPYVQPPISAGKKPIPLLLMTRGKALSADEFERARNTLYREVYNLH